MDKNYKMTVRVDHREWELEREEYDFEEYPKEQVDKIFKMALIDMDRKIDSLKFDIDDAKNEKKKIMEALKL